VFGVSNSQTVCRFAPKAMRLASGVLFFCALSASAQQSPPKQHRPMDVPSPTQSADEPTRTRLILKDGTYQLVYSYKIVGDIVRYRSAERDGEEEDVPLALIDMPATEKWKKDHEPGANRDQGAQTAVISPELAREEAARAALMPEIAPDLRLPEEDSVLALDTFRGTPELVPMPQTASDLNKETAHAEQKGTINPASSPHRITDIPRERSDIQLHVPDPVFYVRIAGAHNDEPVTGGGGFTVNTHGASGRATPSGGDANSGYVIERVDVRTDARIVDSFRIGLLGTGQQQRDIIEMKSEILPGGHWMKLTPLQPLDFGEYALIEVLGRDTVNLDVWDFGIHSDAKENVEAIHPEPKRAPSLERRRP
jgi:hypothetical protein